MEIDGSFDLVNEQCIEVDLSASYDMHIVFKDNNGLTLDESFIVENIEYALDGEGEWQASTVGDWWSNTTNQNAGPGGESEGPEGSVGPVDDSPAPSGLQCGLPIALLTGATDYGMEELVSAMWPYSKDLQATSGG